MSLTQKSWAVCLVSAALLGSYGVSAQTETPQTSPSRSFVTDLAKAKLAKDGNTDPTDANLLAAKADIQAQRDSGMGWGAIANSLGLKLGAVVSAANRAEPATQNAANKSEKSGQAGQSASTGSRSDSGAGNSGGKGGGNSGGNGGGGGGNSGGGGRGK